jgi:hypothetical protein
LEETNYTELHWRWVLGVALGEFVRGMSEDAALFARNPTL